MDIDPTDQSAVPVEGGEPEVPETPEGEEQHAEGSEEEAQPQSKSQNAKQRLRRKYRNEQAVRMQLEEENRHLRERFETLERKLDPVINPAPPRPARVDFDTDEDYEDALFEWRDTSKRSSPVPEPEPQAAPVPQGRPDPVSPDVRKNWDEQLEKASDKYEDFEDAIVSIPREAMTETMTFAIMESDEAGEVAYFLGTNHTEADRIARLSPSQQVREIDKLANKFKSTTSNAPAPITPTKGGTETTTDLSKLSPEEYRDHRRKQGMPW